MEDFVNYSKPSLFLISAICDWKCCKEANMDISICQNNPLAKQPVSKIYDQIIYDAYIANPISKAIVIGGLEPMLQIDEVVNLIDLFRKNGCKDEFVIYTGYYPTEIQNELNRLKVYDNIIVKFGRYVPNRPSRYDDVLGVTLISDNQYAERIS